MFKHMIKILLIVILYSLLSKSLLFAEPFVVHEYSKSTLNETNQSNNSFDKNENYSSYYKIKKNDSLSEILSKFYGNNLNLNIIQSAVVLKNKHVFVRNNANFMFANKKLYLPSINEIKNLVYKTSKKNNNTNPDFTREQDIYYFGN